MSLLGGKRPAKIQGARVVAKKAAKADCQAAEGCGLPHAKLWEKGGALMAYLEASRMKQENNMIDLVATAKDKYPDNLDLFLSASGQYQGHSTSRRARTEPRSERHDLGLVRQRRASDRGPAEVIRTSVRARSEV